MNLKQHGKVFLNGLIVAVPIIVTVYIVWQALFLLDSAIRTALIAPVEAFLPRYSDIAHVVFFPGLGVMVGIAAIYFVGLFARTWLLRAPLRAAEAIVERIPLVKSLYTAVRDLLKFLGGPDSKSRGKPCVVESEDGAVQMLGLVTQQKPRSFLPGETDTRVAVYLPMSYQIGGYTVYVPAGRVRSIEGMSVEELMKLCMTAGIGSRALTTPLQTEEKPDEDDGD